MIHIAYDAPDAAYDREGPITIVSICGAMGVLLDDDRGTILPPSFDFVTPEIVRRGPAPGSEPDCPECLASIRSSRALVRERESA